MFAGQLAPPAYSRNSSLMSPEPIRGTWLGYVLQASLRKEVDRRSHAQDNAGRRVREGRRWSESFVTRTSDWRRTPKQRRPIELCRGPKSRVFRLPMSVAGNELATPRRQFTHERGCRGSQTEVWNGVLARRHEMGSSGRCNAGCHSGRVCPAESSPRGSDNDQSRWPCGARPGHGTERPPSRTTRRRL